MPPFGFLAMLCLYSVYGVERVMLPFGSLPPKPNKKETNISSCFHSISSRRENQPAVVFNRKRALKVTTTIVIRVHHLLRRFGRLPYGIPSHQRPPFPSHHHRLARCTASRPCRVTL